MDASLMYSAFLMFGKSFSSSLCSYFKTYLMILSALSLNIRFATISSKTEAYLLKVEYLAIKNLQLYLLHFS